MSHRSCLVLILFASTVTAQILKEKKEPLELNPPFADAIKPLTPEEMKKDYEKRPLKTEVPDEWPLFRGHATRVAANKGGLPFLEPTWHFDLVTENASKKWLTSAADQLEKSKQPLLSSFHPLTVILRRDGKAIPLVVHMSHWGIHARMLNDVKSEDSRQGEIYWEAPGTWSLERMIKEPKYSRTIDQWLEYYINNQIRPGILFENSVSGMLSGDSKLIYRVEDLQVAYFNQPAQRRPPGIPERIWQNAVLENALQHNRLQAYEQDSGLLLWEIGSDDGKDELAPSYFLSAPLPLDKKLFVLNEKDRELRLLTLDPPTGKVLSVRPLATYRDLISTDIRRRFLAAQLAYAEGVLVAPTHAGTVLGVDAQSGKVRWAYVYREKQAPKKPEPRIGPFGMPREGEEPAIKPITWRDSVPMIAKGRVVYAPPDGNALLCISLRDGTPIWKAARREDDVYVGGIVGEQVIVVGKSSCRAINLSDGNLAWTLDTGMPSGLGVAVEGQYYLPLAASLTTGTPEICVIDVTKGNVAARIRFNNKEVVGNLLFHGGKLISQTTTTIAVYPLQKEEEQAVEQLLKKNPKDPEALVRRGLLRLNKGEHKSAIEDYTAARQPGLSADLLQKLNRGLFEATLAYLEKDFAAALTHLKAAEELSKTDPGCAKSELSRRRRAFLVTVGRGHEKQKKLVEAVRCYLDLIDVAEEGEMIPVPGEGGLKVSLFVFARRQIEKALEAASDEDRKKIEQEFLERLKKKQSNRNDLKPLRALAAVLGSSTSVGRTARLALADQLYQGGGFLEAEQALLEVRRQKHDRNDAAKAVHALARHCVRESLLPDAVYFFRELGRDFGDVVVFDKKTGKEIFDELLTDRRMLPYLEQAKVVPGKMVYKAKEERGIFYIPPPFVEIERKGEPLPYFEKHVFGMRHHFHQLKLRSLVSNDDLWSAPFRMDDFLSLLRVSFPTDIEPKLHGHNLGHLVLLALGHRMIAVDPVKRAVLWDMNTWNVSESRTEPTIRQHVYDPRDGSLRIHYADGWVQRIPSRLLVTSSVVVIPRRIDLIGVEPLTGRVLWSRAGIPDAADLFHDGEHLFVVEMDEKREPTKTHVLNMLSGENLKKRGFTNLYHQRIRSHGRTLLLSETDEKGALTLWQYDLIAGQNLWTKTFAPQSLMLGTDDDALTGAVQPDGKVFVFDLDQGKQVMTGEMEVEHVKNVEAFHLLRDPAGYYVGCRETKPKNVLSFESNFKAEAGMRGPMVRGKVYAFDTKGTLRWYTAADGECYQVLLLNRFREMPVIVLSGRQKTFHTNSGRESHQIVTHVVDKTTGKIIWQWDETTLGNTEIQAVQLDEKGTVEVYRADTKLRIEPR